MSMRVWQADFYRRPRQNVSEQIWELLICNEDRTFTYEAICPQSQVNSSWVAAQLQTAAQELPDLIQVFRPQALSLIELACQQLGILVEPTRHTKALKQWLQERLLLYSQDELYNPLALDKPPPTPLPEKLWGDKWRFASLSAGDLEATFADRLIPIFSMPQLLLPLNLGLASNVAIPGVVIDGGRQSMQLARWLDTVRPVALNYVAGTPDGIVLEAGLVERWIVATFTDQEVAIAAQVYKQRQQESQGLHFLLVQPDDSGMTYSGFWLLQAD